MTAGSFFEGFMEYFYYLYFGNLCFEFQSERPLKVEDAFQPFLREAPWNQKIIVTLSWGCKQKVGTLGEYLGRNFVQSFYRQGAANLCALEDIGDSLLSVAYCDDAYSQIRCCFTDEMDYGDGVDSLIQCLRSLPMREIFIRHHILFFHASQIVLGDTGILFAAASGTGKTTQSKLWERYGGARIVCNDRTLVCDGMTYGYLYDGAEPVYSTERNRLGALVLLAQAPENTVVRLRPAQALKYLLMQQLVCDWDLQGREMVLSDLLGVVDKIPVYLLRCTQYCEAVDCLRKQLLLDGVISDGTD